MFIIIQFLELMRTKCLDIYVEHLFIPQILWRNYSCDIKIRLWREHLLSGMSVDVRVPVSITSVRPWQDYCCVAVIPVQGFIPQLSKKQRRELFPSANAKEYDVEVLLTWITYFLLHTRQEYSYWSDRQCQTSSLSVWLFPGEKSKQALMVHACVSIFSVCALAGLDRRPPDVWEEPRWRGPSPEGSLSVRVGLRG